MARDPSPYKSYINRVFMYCDENHNASLSESCQNKEVTFDKVSLKVLSMKILGKARDED
ncbi:hypothetical protein PCC7424_2397 [Gloeothece citriformis PCC 7424]|uniref:Uncharacterized protein n=1 Tax=Gloeothece citriformis (strain PCC 7424) TaxID=65393 RepID=B7KIY2_GLOC7|nr:hypothetical protein PCC7424_2397 [Gloeothece citriformis PCC 7424]